MRVLLVDDEEELVSTISERLSLRGIESDWAINIKGVTDLVGINKYDVAVLDIKMPGISGFDIKRIIQNIDPNVKFIFLTGHGSENDYIKGSVETVPGFYLVKPIDIGMLISKINEIMEL